jgi:hypothetical protein
MPLVRAMSYPPRAVSLRGPGWRARRAGDLVTAPDAGHRGLRLTACVRFFAPAFGFFSVLTFLV